MPAATTRTASQRAAGPEPDERADLRRGRRARRCAEGRDPADDAEPRHRLDPRVARRNVVDPEVVRDLPLARARHLVDRPAGAARRSSRSRRSALEHFVLPLEPMIGCFGVAPSSARPSRPPPAPRTAATWTIAASGPGATVWFPVAVDGALFFLGDCHAMQGDGEIVGTGIETSYEVEVRLTVEKGRKLGLAARRERRGHLLGRQCPPARPGAAARHDRNVQLARRPTTGSTSRPPRAT